MDAVDAILRELADDPADYERQGGTVMLTRQGREYALSLKEMPGVGLTIDGESDAGVIPPAPLAVFVQNALLDLPRLATQIVKVIDKLAATRPAKYVDGPAIATQGAEQIAWTRTSQEFRAFLDIQEMGTTRLVQLMAGAGQGKTVLLEQMARESALAYVPDSYPTPFILSVDLLGRYVGTVDDAIAGSLNNTYMFPGLTQRDVALCIRNRWIVLALDGFDELVARVGARDAFQRVTELLDQLRGSGTIILSAREAFFELYQISAAIRSFLQPRSGSYSTSIVRLTAWTEAEGRTVFSLLGSTRPEADLSSLLQAFGNDRDIVLQPFFLTRLASLWQRGERFAEAAAQEDPRWRTEYIIQTYIDRETNQKWRSRDGTALLDTSGHRAMLSGIAEEMWRSGAFRLSDEEVRLAAHIALLPLGLPPVVVEGAVERAPTHAALIPRDRGYAFVHERFFQYYLAVRLTDVLIAGEASAMIRMLDPRELSPDTVRWVDWLLRDASGDRERALLHVLALSRATGKAKVLEANIADLLGVLLANHPEPVVVRDLAFVGEALRSRTYSRVTFVNCEFWQLDATGTKLTECAFDQCRFGDVLINSQTEAAGSVFTDSPIQSIESVDGRIIYEPDQIRQLLEAIGAVAKRSADVNARQEFAARVRDDAVQAVGKLVKRSQRASDISLDEINAFFVDGKKLVRAGVEAGVLRYHEKATSGPKKEFIRFQVDRQLILRGQREPTGDARVDAFWSSLAAYFPRRA